MNTCTSTPKTAPANASDEPHWPAPVSVVIRLHARLAVVVRLRDGGVGLMAAGGTDPFVLVVDPRRGLQRTLQAPRPIQRGDAPLPIDVPHRPGNLDFPLGRRLLQDQRCREERCQIVGTDRLQRAGVQHRWRRCREIRHDVVPVAGNAGFVEQVLDAVVHVHGPRGDGVSERWIGSCHEADSSRAVRPTRLASQPATARRRKFSGTGATLRTP